MKLTKFFIAIGLLSCLLAEASWASDAALATGAIDNSAANLVQVKKTVETYFVQEASELDKNTALQAGDLVEQNLIRLLVWSESDQKRATPAVDYDRTKQFGHWVRFKNSKVCYNTRALVLLRDSVVQAKSTDEKPCTIEQGEWFDPYSNQKFTSDDQVQIDHMVPLKEAYLAGAHEWTQAKRCVYANFMGFKPHLIAASNFENQSKSDQTPENYLPPSRDYVCTYLKNWLSVKLIWKMSMTKSEASAIRQQVKDFACNESDFIIQKSIVSDARISAKKLEAICPLARVVTTVPRPRVR